MRILYCWLWYLLLPLVLLRLLWRSQGLPAYRQRILQRFGWVKLPKEAIWLHTVSVGETLAATRLVAELQAAYPNQPLVITCMTPTGSAQIAKSFAGIAHCYAPYDLPGAVNRFFDRAQPKALILLETELWPNWLHAARRRQVPVMLVNGRLSERSFRGYQRLNRLFLPLWPALSVVAAQYQADAERFVALGIKCPVLACGSLKFDLQVPDTLPQQALQLRQAWQGRPVWIAGCTHEGEERQLLQAHQLVRQHLPDALLLLVPRHPDRFERVAALIEASGLDYVRRSGRQALSTEAVYLADTMGELLLLYAASDLAFVGGSLVERGGHNLLEPAAVGVPVLTGPSSFNFARINELLLEAQALLQVDSAQSLADSLLALWQRPELAAQQAQRALQVVERNKGSVARVCDALTPVLDGLCRGR